MLHPRGMWSMKEHVFTSEHRTPVSPSSTWIIPDSQRWTMRWRYLQWKLGVRHLMLLWRAYMNFHSTVSLDRLKMSKSETELLLAYSHIVVEWSVATRTGLVIRVSSTDTVMLRYSSAQDQPCKNSTESWVWARLTDHTISVTTVCWHKWPGSNVLGPRCPDGSSWEEEPRVGAHVYWSKILEQGS